MTKGNFNASLKLAKEKYDYKSPENPGNLPMGIILNSKNYIVCEVTINRTATKYDRNIIYVARSHFDQRQL